MDPLAASAETEYWQRGPVPGIPDLLQPVAHTLLQVRQELQALAPEIDVTRLWEKPAGLASAGFHLLHMTGVLDRLFTYAEGAALGPEQLEYLHAEAMPAKVSLDQLLRHFSGQVDLALDQLSRAEPATLTEPRFVGRKKIVSTRIGLFFHCAEHLMRHYGQLLVTVRACLKVRK